MTAGGRCSRLLGSRMAGEGRVRMQSSQSSAQWYRRLREPFSTRKQQYRPWEEGGPSLHLGDFTSLSSPSPFFTHKAQLVRPHICDVNVTPSAKLQGCLCNRTLYFQKVVDWCWSFPTVGLGFFIFPLQSLVDSLHRRQILFQTLPSRSL